jgi:hypothetical protein
MPRPTRAANTVMTTGIFVVKTLVTVFVVDAIATCTISSIKEYQLPFITESAATYKYMIIPRNTPIPKQEE